MMAFRPFAWAGLLVSCLALGGSIHFDRDALGKLPSGWSSAMTHTGGAPKWEVLRDDSEAKPRYVLSQSSQDRTAGRFPLAIFEGASITDGTVSVAFKTVSGTIDQAAGVVWRYLDPNNYYIARANALESNVVFYKVEKGIRLSIAPKGLPSRSYGVKHAIPQGRWNTLRVDFQGSVFTVYFNGERLFEAEDPTFTKAGKMGLWTKADSVTYFDEFTYSGK